MSDETNGADPMTAVPQIRLVAEQGSILEPCLRAKPDIDEDLRARLRALEEYDFAFLLLGLSPRRLLRDGRLFDNEQVLPLLLHFAQWDNHVRYWVSEVFRQWLVFNPSVQPFEPVDNEKAAAFRDYFWEKYAIPLVEEFRKFVALTMLYPTEMNAPAGPVDMVWHSFLLCTREYYDFGKRIWLGASTHNAPDVPDDTPVST